MFYVRVIRVIERAGAVLAAGGGGGFLGVAGELGGAREVVEVVEGGAKEFVSAAGEGPRGVGVHAVRCIAGGGEGCIAQVVVVVRIVKAQIVAAWLSASALDPDLDRGRSSSGINSLMLPFSAALYHQPGGS